MASALPSLYLVSCNSSCPQWPCPPSRSQDLESSHDSKLFLFPFCPTRRFLSLFALFLLLCQVLNVLHCSVLSFPVFLISLLSTRAYAGGQSLQHIYPSIPRVSKNAYHEKEAWSTLVEWIRANIGNEGFQWFLLFNMVKLFPISRFSLLTKELIRRDWGDTAVIQKLINQIFVGNKERQKLKILCCCVSYI